MGFMWTSHDMCPLGVINTYIFLVVYYLQIRIDMHTSCTSEGTRVSPDPKILTFDFAEFEPQTMGPLHYI